MRLNKIIVIFFIIVIISMFAYCIGKIYKINSSDAYPAGYYQDDPLPDKTAYLTFDDGPSDWTDGILDVLDDENIKATFFISGDWAPKSNRINNDFKKYRTTLLRMIQEGHVLGNHAIDHKDLAFLKPEEIRRQFTENQELLNKEIGFEAPKMTIIRPPFGSPWRNQQSIETRTKVGKIIKSIGVIALWSRHFDSSDSMEWVKGEWFENGPRIHMGNKEFQAKMRRIYKRIIKWANGQGVVILFHDTHPTTLDILPAIIEMLKIEGYHFATMEDFIQWKYKRSSREIVNEFAE